MSTNEQIAELMQLVSRLAAHSYQRGITYTTPGDYGITEKLTAQIEAHARKMVEGEHASDCAVHNGPAYPAGPCDCATSTMPAPAPGVNGSATLLTDALCASKGWMRGYAEARVRSAIDGDPVAPAQQEAAEPVGYVCSEAGIKSAAITDGNLANGAALYAQPAPARLPLTDDQIIDLMPEEISPKHDGDLLKFGRAIEAAHGITPQQEGEV